jgi:pimeloyl-ACP methyl ester carboxylesterase
MRQSTYWEFPMRPHRSSLLAVLATLAVTAAPAATPIAGFELTPCSPPGVQGSALCGVFEVFENRAAQSGRKIGLHVVLLPASGATARPEPLVPLAGGPGDSITKNAAGFSADIGLRARQPVLLVDLRGTGKSNGLFCSEMMGAQQVQGFLDEFLPVAGVRACAAEWRERADPAQYTTAAMVDDLEELRLALRLPKFDLEGGSYGTRVALEYLRRHPQGVRSAILEGAFPPGARAPLTYARDTQTALDGVLAACAADAACHAAFPDPAEDLRALLAQLAEKPARVTVSDAKTGEPQELSLSPQGLAQVIRYSLYLPSTSAQIPMFLRQAALGDFRPVADLAQFWGGAGVQMADGLFLSITCAEDVAFFDQADVAAATRDTFMGDFRVRSQRAACAEWKVPAIAKEATTPVHSDVPTLVLSGQWDPVTPPRWGEEVTRTLANGRHLVVAGGGHGFEGMSGAYECLDSIRHAFADAASVEKLDTSCLGTIARPPWTMRWAGADRIELAAADLDAYTGTFTGQEGSFEIKKEENRLRFYFAGMPPFWLQAMQGGRFQIVGLPEGFALDAVRDTAGQVSAYGFSQGGTEAMVFDRQQPTPAR